VARWRRGPSETPLSPPLCSWPFNEVLPSVKRAALFLADVLESVNATAVLKKHGIQDKKYKARLVQKLRTQYGLQPAPRCGRPPVYTAEQLRTAKDILTSPPHPFHSTAQLVAELKEEHVLGEEARSRGFGPALKRNLGDLGLALAMGCAASSRLSALSTSGNGWHGARRCAASSPTSRWGAGTL